MSGDIRNVLFIMCDQLRADYLGCYGHPTIRTPNIDALAARGVRFDRAYVQSPVCGPSRMSCYTGRYVSSHGANWNRTPLRVDERTMADYLSPLGVKTAIIGKTHIEADTDSLDWLGLPEDAQARQKLSQGGFFPVERDDGVHRSATRERDFPYNQFLRENGFDGENPWQSWANSAEDEYGEILSGWQFRNASRPARIPEPFSETAYMSDRAIEFITDNVDQPWCLHLSYIKPHWPYMAPAPYNDMYGPEDTVPAKRNDSEKENPHPIAGVLMNETDSRAFHNEQTRQTVIPTYMGLISQLDAHLGRVLAALDSSGQSDQTLIVFTSDHGDFLGDHWLADKAMFYEPAVRVPLIIHDPRQIAKRTRGTVTNALVEAIDLVPTFLDAMGGDFAEHRLEGCSLMPMISGENTAPVREAVISELDFGYLATGSELGLKPCRSTGRMIRTDSWKYVHFHDLPGQLFDLMNDPDELNDLHCDAGHQSVLQEMKDRLLEWSLARRTRVTDSDAKVKDWLERAKARGASKPGW